LAGKEIFAANRPAPSWPLPSKRRRSSADGLRLREIMGIALPRSSRCSLGSRRARLCGRSTSWSRPPPGSTSCCARPRPRARMIGAQRREDPRDEADACAEPSCGWRQDALFHDARSRRTALRDAGAPFSSGPTTDHAEPDRHAQGRVRDLRPSGDLAAVGSLRPTGARRDALRCPRAPAVFGMQRAVEPASLDLGKSLGR
jgi:hypothetical protein